MDYYEKLATTIKQYEQLFQKEVTSAYSGFIQENSFNILKEYAALLSKSYQNLVNNNISEHLQSILSDFADKISIACKTTDDSIVEPTKAADPPLELTKKKRRHYTVMDIITILSFLLTLIQFFTSMLDSCHEEVTHKEEMEVITEQRDYIALIYEQLLTILDNTAQAPSPTPSIEPVPPSSPSVPVSAPDGTQEDPDISAGKNEN